MSTTANAIGVSAAPQEQSAASHAAGGEGRATARFLIPAAIPEAELRSLGARVAEKYGPRIGWDPLLKLLEDRTCVAYPCELRFDSEPLLPGEFGHVARKGLRPDDGFILFLHPHYSEQPDVVPYLVLHQLARVNYGEAASAEEAELLGSCALGIPKDDYFRILCDLADQLDGDDLC